MSKLITEDSEQTSTIRAKIARYFTRQTLPYWCILLMDCFLLLIAELSVIYILEGTKPFQPFWLLLCTLAFYLIPYLIAFKTFHTYLGVIRFSSFADLRRISMSVIMGCVLSIALQAVLGQREWLVQLRPADFIFSAVLVVAAMMFVRICVKSIYEVIGSPHRNTRVFIYGVRSGGVALAKNINSNPDSQYIVAGFVTDCGDLVDKRLFNSRVYLNDENLVDIMRRHNSNVLLVSPLKSDVLRSNEDMVNRLIEGGIHIMMMSAAQEWDGKSDLSFTHLREVNVKDLLPRAKIEIDMTAVANLLSGKRILITGAAGSIGSEMVRQIAPYNPDEMILVDQAETPLHETALMMAHDFTHIKARIIIGDISNKKRMEEVFRDYKPEYVFHAAAYKHVPMMENNPYESIVNNVDGTRIIADLAVKYNAKKFVMISTDKAVNPTNVMGCSKRICEIYVQALDKAIKEGKVEGETQFVTTRFGNVLGSNGSVIPLFEKQIKEGGPVTVTHPDIIRYFMLIPEACKLVLEAGTMGNGGEIFVFDMGKPVRIADLARRMIKLSGAPNIEIKFTGLREGEKLYEEVLNDKEITVPTFHEKIKIAKVREYDYAEVNRRITELIKTSETSDDMTIVAAMKDIVPEYHSQHSRFEVLDKTK